MIKSCFSNRIKIVLQLKRMSGSTIANDKSDFYIKSMKQNQKTQKEREATKNIKGKVPAKNFEQAAKIIKSSNIVCFDVDSTVIKEEGIDELASYCGKGKEVARVTSQAMGGSMTFQDALNIRLNIIRPSQKDIANFIKLHPSTLSDGVCNFIRHLKSEGKEIYLISGGFDCLIEPVAQELGIPAANIFANKLLFGFNGEYEAFDENQPTSRSGGKAVAINEIRKMSNMEDPMIVMIGDGATDLEAANANYFIGYGGNIIRNEVYEQAHYFVNNFDQLYHR